MNHLVDTCVVSDFAQGHHQVVGRIMAAIPDGIAVSVITGMEIAYGLHLNPKLSRRIKAVLDDFLDAVHPVTYEKDCRGKDRRLAGCAERREEGR
jgi:predicted nucleic acid-binding protein